jgi:hypothetical protein
MGTDEAFDEFFQRSSISPMRVFAQSLLRMEAQREDKEPSLQCSANGLWLNVMFNVT